MGSPEAYTLSTPERLVALPHPRARRVDTPWPDRLHEGPSTLRPPLQPSTADNHPAQQQQQPHGTLAALVAFINRHKLTDNRPTTSAVLHHATENICLVGEESGKIRWIQPSGPRRPKEGTEDEVQGIVSAEETPNGGVLLRITLLASGFVIGPSGSSVREICRATAADIKSWTESTPQGARSSRSFVIEGSPDAVAHAISIITDAVDRYKELCEGKYCGRYVSRQQVVQGLAFTYQPPPRTVVPIAAALRGGTGSPGARSRAMPAGGSGRLRPPPGGQDPGAAHAARIFADVRNQLDAQAAARSGQETGVYGDPPAYLPASQGAHFSPAPLGSNYGVPAWPVHSAAPSGSSSAALQPGSADLYPNSGLPLFQKYAPQGEPAAGAAAAGGPGSLGSAGFPAGFPAVLQTQDSTGLAPETAYFHYLQLAQAQLQLQQQQQQQQAAGGDGAAKPGAASERSASGSFHPSPSLGLPSIYSCSSPASGGPPSTTPFNVHAPEFTLPSPGSLLLPSMSGLKLASPQFESPPGKQGGAPAASSGPDGSEALHHPITPEGRDGGFHQHSPGAYSTPPPALHSYVQGTKWPAFNAAASPWAPLPFQSLSMGSSHTTPLPPIFCTAPPPEESIRKLARTSTLSTPNAKARILADRPNQAGDAAGPASPADVNAAPWVLGGHPFLQEEVVPGSHAN